MMSFGEFFGLITLFVLAISLFLFIIYLIISGWVKLINSIEGMIGKQDNPDVSPEEEDRL
jgi:hypothetical protein